MNAKDIDFNKDYYKILETDRTASQADIKKAFRKMSLKYHPDRHTSDSEEDKKIAADKFVEVNEAYSVLSDETLRKAYDSGPADPFLFNIRDNEPSPGRYVLVRVNVNYDDICNGIKNKVIKYRRNVRCKSCHGKGGEDVQICQRCYGTGMITETHSRMGMIFRQQCTCTYCHGQGKHINKVCCECHGTGLTEKEETYNLSLTTENLIKDRSQTFVGYYGNESTDERGRDGELVIEVVHNLPDNINIVPTYNGWSVVETRDIPYYDMLLGCKETVVTPSGKKFAISIPGCCANNTSLRINNQGFTVNGITGDYILNVSTKQKNELSDGERKLLKKIKKINEK